jgi:ribosomal protein S18 acetylase RimI-like enzyme
MNIKVRRLGADDTTDAIQAVRRLKEPHGSTEASSEHMRRLLADERNYLYVAFEDSNPVGFLIAHRFPRIDRDQDMVYLYEIDVEAEHHRKGIGTALIDALKRDCREVDVMKIWVGTEAENESARRLYESTGALLQSDEFVEYLYEDS